jgi:hypothetical protein
MWMRVKSAAQRHEREAKGATTARPKNRDFRRCPLLVEAVFIWFWVVPFCGRGSGVGRCKKLKVGSQLPRAPIVLRLKKG